MESQGFKEEALAVSSDPDHRFELAVDLRKMDVAHAVLLDPEVCIYHSHSHSHSHIPSQYTFLVQPLNTSSQYQYIISALTVHVLNALLYVLYQHSSQTTLSTHPINPPYQLTLSNHLIKPPHQPTLSTHPINPFYPIPRTKWTRTARIIRANGGGWGTSRWPMETSPWPKHVHHVQVNTPNPTLTLT